MPGSDPPPTIGFWFQHPPLVDGTHEGICRAFGWILKGLSGKNTSKVLVATPIWAHQTLLKLLDQHEISRDRVEIVVSRRSLPIFLRLAFRHLGQKRERRQRLPAVIDRAKDRLAALSQTEVVTDAFFGLLSTDSALLVTGLLLVAAVAAIVLSPLLAFGVILFFAARRLRALWRRLALVSRLQRRANAIFSYLYRRLLDHEYEVLAAKASARRDVKVWYVAWPWAAEAARLQAPVIVSLWDFVYTDFPTGFNAPLAVDLEDRYRKLLERADAVATNSDYVRQEHAVRYFRMQPEVTHLVRIAPHDYRHWLREAERSGDSRQEAASIIRDFLHSKGDDEKWNSKRVRDYLLDFPFGEVPFLFNSTQIRPHKNTLNLLRAYERLLRRRHIHLKLIVTGRPEHHAETGHFVDSRMLNFDVLPLPQLPSEVHAAFYHLASLTIVPTLFEGGFPFPFHESLSVNTPVLMGRVPIVSELVPDHLAGDMLFNPFDVTDIARKIRWALENRTQLLARQMVLHHELSDRTSEHTAAEYGALLERFAIA